VCQHLTVARVAEGLGVSWNTANDAVLAEGRRVLIEDPHRFDGVRVIGVGLSAAWVAGIGTAGAVVSMREAYPRAPQAGPAEGWPPARPVPEGRLAVAVVLGASGSVITDALGPYEVFARSPTFFVYTVSASRPTAMLSGGLAVVPDYSLADVDAGLAPEPDVVVVPAVAAPSGTKEVPLREWITRRVDRGAHLLGVCNGSRLLAAAGLLDGRRATAHWSRIRSLERSRPQWTGSAASATSKTAPSPLPPG
jgi:putative intracellular protease/amidase